MKTLQGETVFLRALEPSDLEFLYLLENDEKFWEISHTQTPYSKYVLQQYLEKAHLDIYQVKQLRLVICESQTKSPVGFIDLYDFNPKHRRAGIGIVIFSDKQKKKGYATEALKLLIKYSFTFLDLHQLYAGITVDNPASLKLFEKQGFLKTGEKKDWIFSENQFKTEYFYQLIYE